MKVILSILFYLLLLSCTEFQDYKTINNITNSDLKKNVEFHYNKKIVDLKPISSWWQQLKDDNLTMIIEKALVNNQDIKIAAKNIKKIKNQSYQAELDFYPTLDAEFNYTDQKRSLNAPEVPVNRDIYYYDSAINTSWEVDLFDKLSDTEKLYDASIKKSTYDKDAIKISIASQVASSYIKLRGSQVSLNIYENSIINYKKTYELTKKLIESGKRTNLDLLKIDAQLQLVKSTIPTLKADINKSINTILLLIGEYDKDIINILKQNSTLPDLPELIRVGEASDLFKLRPDIKAHKSNILATISKYNLETADLYPKLNIIGYIGFIATNLSNLTLNDSFSYQLNPNLNWSFIDFTKTKSKIKNADIDTKITIDEYQKVVLNAVLEVENAIDSFKKESQKRNLLHKTTILNNETLNLVNIRFKEGKDNTLSLLDAEKDLLNTKIQLSQSETNLALNLIAIYKSLGVM